MVHRDDRLARMAASLAFAAVIATACSSATPVPMPEPRPDLQQKSEPENRFARDVLAAHNSERARVGDPPLVWSDTLAQHAAVWAQHLAQLGRMEHSALYLRPGEGENLWMGTANYFSTDAKIEYWTRERADFRYGEFPDISDKLPWNEVAHYTQIVWRDTKTVGCATAVNGKLEVLVCRYGPPGNWMGQKPY
ncbi:MAG: CAP domain-containing protein [Rhizomicrobium sp.]|jgi:hypothetical protein